MLLVMWIIVTILLLFPVKKLKRFHILWYCLAALFSYVTFTLIIHFDQAGVRLQLPLIIIWAPAFGYSDYLDGGEVVSAYRSGYLFY